MGKVFDAIERMESRMDGLGIALIAAYVQTGAYDPLLKAMADSEDTDVLEKARRIMNAGEAAAKRRKKNPEA